MNVLLVNPEFPETYWSFRHALPLKESAAFFLPSASDGVSAVAQVMESTTGRSKY